MTVLSDPDRSFALDHVPTAQRDGVAALWALDEHLGQLVASTTQPPLGQMRLLWWREALETGARGHPVLEAMTSLRTAGIDARALGIVIDGWEELLEPLPLDDDQLARYAAFRGGQLFALSARLLMGVCPESSGAAWALADFGLRCSDPETSARALEMARVHLSAADLQKTPRPLRILVRLVRNDIVAGRRTARTPWRLLRSIA